MNLIYILSFVEKSDDDFRMLKNGFYYNKTKQLIFYMNMSKLAVTKSKIDFGNFFSCGIIRGLILK